MKSQKGVKARSESAHIWQGVVSKWCASKEIGSKTADQDSTPPHAVPAPFKKHVVGHLNQAPKQ